MQWWSPSTRQSLNLSQLGIDKYAQNEHLNKLKNYKEYDKKDRPACGRCRFKERINLLHDSLSFL